MDNIFLINTAFQYVRQLELAYGDDMPWSAIEKGFNFDTEKVLFANKARGIFKPRQMSRGVLSIKTTIPRKGRVNIYTDEEGEEGYFKYSLQQGDPYSGGNKHLWEALEDKTPFIYFYPVAPSVYKALWPCYVVNIYPDRMFCEVVVGAQPKLNKVITVEDAYKIPETVERKYRISETKVRIHQASFRELVLAAYDNQCAISGLPVKSLLEAAHIIPDNEPYGDAVVTNGIALSRIHHKAFDANLIGIDKDYKVHVSEQLLSISDGPLLEDGLKSFHGKYILLPKNSSCAPDKERLEERFTLYMSEQ